MLRPPLQPKVELQRALARRDADEADVDHADDAGFLGVDRGRSVTANELHEAIEHLAHDRIPPREMAGELVPSARVPEVCGDETMAALRAAPSRAARQAGHAAGNSVSRDAAHATRARWAAV